MQVRDQNVLVMGMARSGAALAETLLEEGARVTAYDQKSDASMDAVREKLGGRVTWALGGDPDRLIENCDMIFISPGVPAFSAALERARALGRPVVGEIEYAARLNRAPIAAITGTNGKTTTTALLGEIMRGTGRKTYVVGNIGTPFVGVAKQTRKEDVVVAEISSFQLETAETFHPRCAAVLNITEDHLNRHGTMKAYIACKARIFNLMEGDDCAVLNRDEPLSASLAADVACRVRFFTKGPKVDDGACVVDNIITLVDKSGARAVLPVSELKIPGAHNLENALAAAAMADAMGAPLEVIAQGLRTFPGVEHRIEPAGEVDGVRFINDSKGTNCDATLRAMAAMDRPTVLLVGGYDKGSDYRPLFEAPAGMIKKVVALGATRGRVMDNAAACGFDAIERVDGSFEDAVRRAQALASPGWNVLLSPASASFDMFCDYEERGRVFKRIVARLAEEARVQTDAGRG